MTETSATATLLHTLHDAGPLSRADLARRTGMSASAVSLRTAELIRRGLVQEAGTQRRAMGRPRILLRLHERHALVLGGNVNREGIDAVLADLGGAVLAARSEPLASLEPDEVVRAFCRVAHELVDAAGADFDEVADVGFALSGLVDPPRGMCVDSTVLGWSEVPVGRALEAALKRPVALENDANAVAVGERLFGGAHGRDFAVLSVGQGVGAGLIVGGRLHHGRHGASGELGHCTVEVDGPPCRCGKRGCLEAIASVPAMLGHARELGLDVAELDELERVSHDDARAAAVLDRAGAALGLALTHLVNLTSPELVIVTGSGVRLGDRLAAALRDAFARHLMPMLPAPPELRLRHEDEAVWARGAAGLATRAYLSRGGERPADGDASNPTNRPSPSAPSRG